MHIPMAKIRIYLLRILVCLSAILFLYMAKGQPTDVVFSSKHMSFGSPTVDFKNIDIFETTDPTPLSTLTLHYWFDNGTINTVSGSNTVDVQLPVTSLTTGSHIAYFYFSNGSGKRSAIVSKPFIHIGSGGQLNQMEYWFNDDFNARQNVNVSNPGNADLSVNTNTLPMGSHTLYVRFRLAGQLWSGITSSSFLKASVANGATEMEYWFNNEFDQKKNIPLQSLAGIDQLISTTILPLGTHTLYTRFRTNGGIWSAIKATHFLKSTATAEGTEMQYWFDGKVNLAKTITVADPLQTDIQTDASLLDSGMHEIAVRFRKQSGYWSGIVVDSFLKGTYAADVDFLTGLIAYYPFNGNTNDESGNANHAVNNGAQFGADRVGSANKALYFDGSNAYLTIPSSVSLESPKEGITITSWIRPEEAEHGYSILCKTDQPSMDPFQYRFGYNNEMIFFGFKTTEGRYVDHSVPYSFKNDIWYHVGVTYNGQQVSFYVNGQLVGSVNQTGNIIADKKPLEAGRDAHGGIEYLKGWLDEIKIYKRALSASEISKVFDDGTDNIDFTCIEWEGTPPTEGWNQEYADAFSYLCAQNVIRKQQFANQINNKLLREELAKITFRALFKPSSHEDAGPSTPADNFPTIYPDLMTGTPGGANYIREAKALLYLEYKRSGSTELDGISPFDRDFDYFNPKRSIRRQFVVKVLLEAFNIKPTPLNEVSFPSGVFDDVVASTEMRGYIHKALQLGIIRSQVTFRPDEEIMRKDALLMLSRLRQLADKSIIPHPVPTATDYFTPNLITNTRSIGLPGIESGNFNSYTKTSFGIAGILPLVFAHSYNSALTELPSGFFHEQPLGVGWTHNYNCYIRRTADDEDANRRYVIFWGDGSTMYFKEENGAFTPENIGIYAQLTKSGDHFQYKTKDQVTYTFSLLDVERRQFWGMTEIRDRNQNKLSITWEKGAPLIKGSVVFIKHRVSKITEPGGRYLQLGYGINGTNRITNVTAYAGGSTRSVAFTYSNNNEDLAGYRDLRGNSTTYSYEDYTDPSQAHLLKRIQLPKGNIIDNKYHQRKLTSTELLGQYKTTVNTDFKYDANNTNAFISSSVSTTRNNQTLTTQTDIDELGNVRKYVTPTDALNIDYDPVQKNKPVQLNNLLNGVNAGMNYDAKGNVLSVTKGGNGITPITETFTYTALNDIASHTNGRSNTTTFAYTNGNLTRITDAAGNSTNFEVLTNGKVKKITSPEGIYSQFTYDDYGNIILSSLMGSISSSASYDVWSRLLESTDLNGIKTRMEYEANDLTKRTIRDPENIHQAVTYGYDANDNLTAITNSMGGITSLTYNDLDQVVEYGFAGFKKQYVYNEDGSLKTFTNQRGDVFTHVYNADGTVKDDGYAAFTYDSEKNIKTITHKENGKVITYEYDGLKRVKQIKYNDYAANGSQGVKYDYDANSNITAITYPDGFKVGYSYDNLDRLIRVFNTQNNATYASYSYLKDGRLSTQTNGNSTKMVYRYDNLGRLDSMANLRGNNTVIAAYGFKLDNIGNHLEERERYPDGLTVPVLPAKAIAYTHDAANRMVTSGSTQFTYDDNGNNTSASGDWNSTYSYDKRDNLITSTSPVINAEYDGLENRRKNNNTRYVLDILGGSNVLMETDLNGNAVAYYIHGLGLVCRLNASKGAPHYYHYDYRGSTVAITNATQQVTHKYKYGPFGEMLNAQEGPFTNVYRYVGKYGVQFEDSTLYFMRARYYNPLKGRFLGEDPVWDENLFSYANNNSIMGIDPTGLITARQKRRLNRAISNANKFGNVQAFGKATNDSPIGTGSSNSAQAQINILNNIVSNYEDVESISINSSSIISNIEQQINATGTPDSEKRKFEKLLDNLNLIVKDWNKIDSDDIKNMNKYTTKFIESLSSNEFFFSQLQIQTIWEIRD